MDENLNKIEDKTVPCEDAVALQSLTDTMLYEFNSLRSEFNNFREEIRKPRRRILLWISIALFLYAAMFLILSMVFSFVNYEVDYETDSKLTEDNTIEITATISKIQPIPYHIQFEEYNAVFGIYNASIVVDMEELGKLTIGQTVVFRIEKEDVVNITKLSGAIALVALKGSSDIITLESYNDYYYNEYGSDDPPAIPFLIIGIVLLTGAILCLVFYKRKKMKEISDLNKQYHYR